MTPIEKNIRVVDEQGIEYEATYPKRAKGLVKHGRARFTDENTICLARPPEITEDKMKKDNITTINEAEIEKIEQAASEAEAKAEEEYATAIAEATSPSEPQADGEITEAKVLSLVERLTAMTEETLKFAASYERVSDDEDMPDEYYDAVQSQHGSINEHVRLIFRSIEQLNATANRMLDYLEKKQQAQSPVSEREFLEFVKDFNANNKTGELPDFVELRKSFNEEKRDKAGEILDLLENPMFDEEFKDNLKELIYEYYYEHYRNQLFPNGTAN